MKKPKSVAICPKCKSLNVQKQITPLSAVGSPEQWVCNNCGFSSYLLPVINPDELKEDKSK